VKWPSRPAGSVSRAASFSRLASLIQGTSFWTSASRAATSPGVSPSDRPRGPSAFTVRTKSFTPSMKRIPSAEDMNSIRSRSG